MAGESLGIGELFVELFFKADQVKLGDFMHSLTELNMASVMTTLGLGAMYEMVSKIMTSADTTALSINNLSAQTGISRQEIQKWSEWTDQAGASADLAKQSFATLAEEKAKLMIGQGHPNAWMYWFGFDPRNMIWFSLMLRGSKPNQYIQALG